MKNLVLIVIAVIVVLVILVWIHQKDPAIGTWAGTAGTGEGTQFIQFQMLPGGHLAFNSTIDVGQPFGSEIFGGGVTGGQGYWKRIGDRKYRTRQTSATVSKDLTPGHNYAGIPSARLVVDSTFTISPDKKELNGEFVVNVYALEDTSFQNILVTVPARPYTVRRIADL